ncbi:hypothetical protein [Roseiconus lacunae]|uniref:Uncharacterized protein n=1 Tax=Roseiconus lacunae TaxID=2605694 RepID=A0ABT7PH20_9BACT|nr:hypothetical protein [Roseiconus lacunae]MDM4015810.1 hypothetical protein [Roseiconus lacunae]
MSDLPGAITNTGHPTDRNDEPIAAGSVYFVRVGRGQPKRVLVIDDFENDLMLCVPCNQNGQPVGDARPQRIDEMSPDVIWERAGMEWS